jgi:hypothetical protein
LMIGFVLAMRRVKGGGYLDEDGPPLRLGVVFFQLVEMRP